MTGPRSQLLELADHLVGMASDVDADIRQARSDGDAERCEFLRGERRGLLAAVEVLRTADAEAKS